MTCILQRVNKLNISGFTLTFLSSSCLDLFLMPGNPNPLYIRRPTESHHVFVAVAFYRLSFSPSSLPENEPLLGPFDDPKNAARGLLLTVERKRGGKEQRK